VCVTVNFHFAQYKCVLCFKVPSSKSDINFLDSKENKRKELDDLSFSISPTNSICKACLALVNKRRCFKERLWELDNPITNLHETALTLLVYRFLVKRNVVRKLGFEPTCDRTFMPATFSAKSTLFSTRRQSRFHTKCSRYKSFFASSLESQSSISPHFAFL
jgi:hypothetical protein